MRTCSYSVYFPSYQPEPISYPTPSPISPKRETVDRPSTASYSIQDYTPTNQTFTDRDIRDTIQIQTIAIPIPSLQVSLQFSPSNRAPSSVSAPQPIDTNRQLPSADYDSLKIPVLYYDYAVFPISITFPPLPVSGQVLVPDFTFDKILSENELNSVSLSKYNLDIPINYNKLTYNVHGKFLLLNNYAEPSYYLTEKSYFKSLIADLLDNYESFLNIESFVIHINRLLSDENNRFFKHLTDKERALFKLEVMVRVYKEILQAKVAHFETVLSTIRTNVQTIFTANKEQLSLWSEKQDAIQLSYKSYIDKVDKDGNLYNTVAKVNADIRELFYFINSLQQHLIEAVALNIERERLIIEHEVAQLNYLSAKSKEQIPPYKIDYLKELTKEVTARYQLLVAEYASLRERLSSSLAKKDAYNASLKATKAELEATVTKINSRGKLIQIENELKLLDRVSNNYIQMLNDYYNILRTLTASYYDIQKYAQSPQIIRAMVNAAQSVSYAVSHVSSRIANAYADFVRAHAWASHMMANANITSNIVEAYA